MSRFEVRLTVFILVMVVGIAAWSKLRHTDKPVYDAPGRLKVQEHPAFRQDR
jgi:hypothetical protein